MDKKKIIAIILFVLLGLFIFTFANPGPSTLDPVEVPGQGEEDKDTDKEQDDNKDEENQDDEQEEDNNDRPVVEVDEAPVIEINPTTVTIVFGQEYDVMTGVKASDDNDIVRVTASITDTSKLEVGTHTITYTTSDRAGHTTTATRTIIVKADENNNGTPDEEETLLNVVFKGFNGVELSKQKVLPGLDAVAPEAPVVEGYVFTGWDKEYTNVQTNLEVNAIYKEDKNNNGTPDEEETLLNVVFKGFNGVELSKQKVLPGLDAVAPEAPVVEGYVFTGWDKEYTNVQTNLEVNAIYESIKPIINSITHNPTIWTNNQVTVTVNASAYEGGRIVEYSFDNGKTWQSTNTYVVSNNTTLNILAKDNLGTISNISEYSITNIDKVAPIISGNQNVNANEQPEAIIKLDITDKLSGVKEATYLPQKYTSVAEYKKAINNNGNPIIAPKVDINNGKAEITVIIDGDYTIYAIDNAGNEIVYNVKVEGIKESGITDEEDGTDTSLEGIKIKYSRTKYKDSSWLGLLWKLDPYRDITVTADKGYTVNEVRWAEGRKDLSYFKLGNGNLEQNSTSQFRIEGSRYSTVYTIYVKYTDNNGEVKEGTVNIYAYARILFWIV